MDWIELIVHTTTDGAESVSYELIELGSAGTMIEDRADIPDPAKPHGIWEIIDPKLIETMPEDVQVHGWFEDDGKGKTAIAGLHDRLELLKADHPEYGTLEIDYRTVSDDTWKDTWKKYYKPFYVTDHMVIKPTWEEFTPRQDDQVIEIDPGMAFGSGTHETTAMCIQLLKENIRGGENVIDVGTGSGILAIAAGLLGAGAVLAVDIDRDAVRVARRNVDHNGLDRIISVQEGDLLKHVKEQCDICVANIISDVIIANCASLMQHIVPGGLFICSGIVVDRTEEVHDALEKAGYQILEERHRGEWTAFLSRRN
jgi:ribosomal protein L11 methyltransferase